MILAVEADSISPAPKILVIGVRQGGENRFWKVWEHKSEEEMVEDFVAWFLREGEKVIIGFNHLKFDIPVLLMKARGLPDFERFFRKLNQANVEDLFVVLTFMGGGRIKSLKVHCRDVDVPWAETLNLTPAGLYAEKKYNSLTAYNSARLDIIGELKAKVWQRYNK